MQLKDIETIITNAHQVVRLKKESPIIYDSFELKGRHGVNMVLSYKYIPRIELNRAKANINVSLTIGETFIFDREIAGNSPLVRIALDAHKSALTRAQSTKTHNSTKVLRDFGITL